MPNKCNTFKMYDNPRAYWYFLVLRQSSGLCPSSLFSEHIVLPQCCKSQILEDLTENVIIGPTIALKYRENVGTRIKRGCF